MARKMKDDNKDTIGEKCVKEQKGNMAFDDCSKAKAWESHNFNLFKRGVSLEPKRSPK